MAVGIPCEASSAASRSRPPGARRIVYCAQTEVIWSDTRGTIARLPRLMSSRRDLVGKNLELFDQHRRLDRVQTAGKAEADVVVLVFALAVNAQAFDDL